MKPSPQLDPAYDVFAGGGEMGALMRSFDWSKTALGPPETWCPTLQTMTRMLLSNSFPILLWWGPDYISLYNDAYIPVLGHKHPHQSLGKPLRECWSEVYPVLAPLIDVPFNGGPATWVEDIPLELFRFGFPEEAHFTISYSPVPDPTTPSGIGGVIAIVHEISAKIVGDRRILALRDLGSRSAETLTAEKACADAAKTLAAHNKDVPFALIYLLDEKGETAHLAGRGGTGECVGLCPPRIDLHDENAPWPLDRCARLEEIVIVDDLVSRFYRLPPGPPIGPWSDPPSMAAIVPISSNISHQLAGFLIAGISSRLRFDDSYSGFLELVSDQIAIAIANARAYETERKRNEALAEIDRAKTTFFSSISHELRTPLTLILGPLEDMLAQPANMSAANRERLEVAHRNSLRLLKLVNTLLDFSRIEAGRIQASYEPVDLAAFTAELASVFRSLIERAGLKFDVVCPPLPELVYIDREMWEKIVFNLLSNAFKFTFDGEIGISVQPAGHAVEVAVSDTGTGIPAEELPELFKRFHRVRGARGRSYEGSGIGLALVQELVHLHGGSIRIESEVDRGTRFILSIPLGFSHLPPDRLGRLGAARAQSSTALASEAYLHEAERWLSNQTALGSEEQQAAAIAARPHPAAGKELVLIADDNADMRDYLTRLLSTEYPVHSVSDGVQAVDAFKNLQPGIIVADIMMPGLDGFGVLRAVRAHPGRSDTPVILLSARAGEESRVEGMQAGADDYMVKPFSARELLARIESHLTLARLRRQAGEEVRQSEARYRALIAATSDVVYQMNPDWTVMSHLEGREFIADTESPDQTWLERYIPADQQALVTATIQEAIRTRDIFEMEHKVLRADGAIGWMFSRAVPLMDENGEIVEWFGAATDITARKTAEEALLRSERLASLGRMAATISHEINNPLEALTNLLYLARSSGEISASAGRYLDQADEELRRVAHITRQSLGFYREFATPEQVSIDALLNSAIDLVKRKIESKRGVVGRQFRAHPEINAIGGELRQVFSNLLVNSVDAIGDRGIIKIRLSSSLNRAGQRSVRVTIADNGSGIPPAARERIFEPLFTTKGAVGTGLGLWVARQIVEKHGGRIQMRSSIRGPHRGSTFSVLLPA